MGCASSKQMKAGVADVYRPPPSSFAVFDINAIEEPWLKLEQLLAPPQNDDEKQTRNPSAAAVPTAVLEKLDTVTEAPPRSWDEVSKALETHLKSPAAVSGETEPPSSTAAEKPAEQATHPPPPRSLSVHTVGAGAADVSRPPPSSFAVFDINAIEEPWLKLEQLLAPPQNDDEKQTRNPSAAAVPTAVLEKLDTVTEAPPRSWDEVSKALETHLKSPAAVSGETEPPSSTAAEKPAEQATHPPPQRSLSVHTVEELEAKTKRDNPKPVQKLRKTESASGAESRNGLPPESGKAFKPLKENIFLVMDREQREKEGKKGPVVNWDPLSEFPEKCPPGGGNGVVIYTTSLRGVRKTYEDCMRVREIMEQQGIVFDERDVALDAGVRTELRELLGEGATPEEVAPPRVFVKGRYVGGAEGVVEMNERGKLGRVMRWARVDRVGEEAWWLPCLHCGGSSKLPSADGSGWERCASCNENGLVRCPLCFTS
ncbi:PREDICTED: uncharacterized protein LOC104825229 [Tarenaya hassleriana]|uniref:uncharacterized protein LOC104825229 n=1 Tax=Tarenaya hassleriana TaxID=28532 RepID=UPI00053C1F81|nr:PREDICTED: uncharacterized protein LOC104825229 [Tarenaya hassleriana]